MYHKMVTELLWGRETRIGDEDQGRALEEEAVLSVFEDN